ncbi:MAG: M6 family metalloprotease domain-containing protein [Bacteroidales bacterium]|nr:M6 family metalloprotease domain-containing protein [Bacteroidales bacterium]
MKRAFLVIAVILCTLVDFATGLNGQPLSRPVKSRGITAYPFPVEVTQPNGSVITLIGKGDGVIHSAETPDGYTVLNDQKGYYCYAVRNENGDLVPSGLRVGTTKGTDLQGIDKHLSYSPAQIDKFTRSYFEDAPTKYNPNPFPSKGDNTVLMILLEFPDQTAVTDRQTFSDLMNQENFNGTGSFRDYYRIASFDSLLLSTTVTAWVTVSMNMAYYGDNDGNGEDIRPQELAREAIDLAEVAGLDFSQFDNDGDGYVDEIIIIHSGFGEEYIGTGDSCIWSHSWHLGELNVVYDGVTIDNYVMAPELRGNEGTDITNVGVICHEFGHSLGLPDFYDTDDTESGGYAFDLTFWDLMADGSWNNGGASPANHNAWSKSYLGWIDLPVLTDPGSYSLNGASEHPEAFKIKTSTYNECFILENRQQIGLDSYVPSSGLLIYHADKNHPGWLTNDINVDPLHQGFDIEEADDIGSYETYGGDPFPGNTDNQSFSGSSVPSSNSWNNEPPFISIHDISMTGGVISFNVLKTFPDALPAGWQINPDTFSYSAGITAMVLLETDTVTSGYLTAWSGSSCRGIAPVTFYPGPDYHFFELQYYSNFLSGDTLSFRYYEPGSDSIYTLHEQFEFIPGIALGEPSGPVHLHHYNHFSKTFVPGWNWFSVNIVQEEMALSQILSDNLAQGDYLKNQTQSATWYDNFGWWGSLDTLDPSSLYMIKTANGCCMELSGITAEKISNRIDLASGWNWIGYLPEYPLPIDSALSSVNLSMMDYIKNQTQSATYYGEYGWFGSLENLVPGEGYMLKVAEPGTLEYPSEESQPAAKKGAGISLSDPSLSGPDPHQYEFNGTVTCRVFMDGLPAGSESDLLLAYAGEECRGISGGMYFDPVDAFVYPLMVYSNVEEGETITFQYFDSEKSELYPCTGSIEFEKDMVVADALNPFELNVNTALDISRQESYPQSALSVFPNPFTDLLNIEYSINHTTDVYLALYDIYGKRIKIFKEMSLGPGTYSVAWDGSGLPQGTYLVKFRTGDKQILKRIVNLD